MASPSDWLEGARLRTLPAAMAPVLLGTAAAVQLGQWSAVRAVLALAVALLLQIGVNFSNDYSDGIRGTDDNRQGPPRLTGGGLAAPRTVLAAALGCFAAAGLAGLVLVVLSGQWVLVAVGVCAVAAAWFYTGGRHPYGYLGIGLSELMVFVFFGLVATVGTTVTQTPSAPWWVWSLASGVGLLSVSLLMVNNIRDIPTDREAGKRTVAVRLGERGSRAAYVALLAGAVVLAGVSLWHVVVTPAGSAATTVDSSLLHTGAAGTWAVGGATVILALGAALPARRVISGQTGRALIPALRDTGLYTLVWAVVCAALLAASA